MGRYSAPPELLKSGVGQGALSFAVLRALAGTGKLTSYELRADFAEQAAGFIKKFLGAFLVTARKSRKNEG